MCEQLAHSLASLQRAVQGQSSALLSYIYIIL